MLFFFNLQVQFFLVSCFKNIEFLPFIFIRGRSLKFSGEILLNSFQKSLLLRIVGPCSNSSKSASNGKKFMHVILTYFKFFPIETSLKLRDSVTPNTFCTIQPISRTFKKCISTSLNSANDNEINLFFQTVKNVFIIDNGCE